MNKIIDIRKIKGMFKRLDSAKIKDSLNKLIKKANLSKLADLVKKIDLQKLNLSKISDISKNKLDIRKLFAAKKIEEVIIVDIALKLTLLNVRFADRIKLKALKVFAFDKENQNETIRNSLHRFIEENQIEHKNAILSPRLDTLLIKRIELPAVPQAELPDAIKWQIKEDVPFDLVEATMDYSIIQKRAKEDGSNVFDIMCVVAREKDIIPQVSLLKQMGFRCLSVSLLPFGYEKLIGTYFKRKDDESLAVLHLSDEICYLTIYKNKKLEFYRELPISISQLRESLKGVLVSEKGKIELSSQQVDEVLYKIGVPLDTDSIYQNKLSAIQILSLLRPALERLAGEIRRSLSYYESEFGSGAVDKILLAGSVVKIPNVDNFLSRELALGVEKISISEKSIGVPSINEDLLENLAALGLAIDYQKNINLLPYEFRTEKFEEVEKVSLRWIAFIAFLLLGVSYLFARAGINSYQKRLDNAILHANVLSEVKEIKTRVDQMNEFVGQLQQKEPLVASILKKLSSIAGRELFFHNLSLNCEKKQGTISGYVKSQRQNPELILTEFVRDMEESVYFTDTSIASVTKSKEQEMNIAEFQINFKLP